VAFLGRWLLKEEVTKKDWWAVTAVLGGMILFFFDQLQWGSLLGNLLAVLSGWTFAFLTVFMRMQKDSSPLESVFLGNIFAALIGLPFAFQQLPAPGVWVNLTLLGTVQLGLSYILYSIAIKGVTALEASLIPVIEPILNPLWVFLAIGEVPGDWALVGSAIILVSIVFWFLQKNHHKRPYLPPPD
jgi:drug/metabolite transporter (DMT)-like permease